MRKTAIILALIWIPGLLSAQRIFQTIVSSTPLVEGESFRVQYVLTDAANGGNLVTPDFRPFRLVSGPDIYGNELNGTAPSTKNYVFTLVALKSGKYKIPGAVFKYEGKQVKSNEVLVEILSRDMAAKLFKQDASSIDYMLRPGENPREKIKENLFVKVSVNKKSCYVGEPVLATFKLYSRLQSKSDIIKNPGFYGFTVFDMVNLQDKMVTTERINGLLFDVHTIRKVQLYPLQAGSFMIDAMQIKNRVEFSRSAVTKKAEQEISEGLLGAGEEAPPEGTEVVESEMSTVPVSVLVKPVPEKNKPESFAGAAGRFSITASLLKNNLSKNEEGVLELTVRGKGNFIQLDAPVIKWPAGMEGFDPVVRDSLDKTTLPLSGSRTFRYTFVSSIPGKYQLPPISFSFFDTDSNQFKTIAAANLPVEIVNKQNSTTLIQEKKTSISSDSEKAARTALIVVFLLVLGVLLYWAIRKKEKPVIVTEKEKPALPDVVQVLEPVYALPIGESTIFYKKLHEGVWQFLYQRFGLSGTGMNKQGINTTLTLSGIEELSCRKLISILEQCEAGIFTKANFEEDTEGLLAQTRELLEKIDRQLNK
ncbi:MAG: BatD family protein [Chitinophagaceae bacterium]